MHIVVIMLENRSFDSFLGYLYSPNDLPQRNIPALGPNEPPFHGLKFVDTTQLTNTFVVDGQTLLSQPPVPSVRATNSPGSDPGEEYEHVCQQLFGSYDPPLQGTPATMTGFLQDYGNEWLSSKLDKAKLDTISQIMHMYTPADLPVLNRLARAYAVSDMWFASVPTQTNANRAFSICGTSLGLVNNGFLSDNVVEAKLADDRFRTDTIWHVLERHGFHDWAVFWSDTYPPIISDVPYTRRVFPRLEQISNIDDHFRKMDDFFTMAEAGILPAFSYLEPQWSGEILKLSVMGNEYHPPADVTPAEDTLRRIYGSLTKNQAAWQDTLLVITFDEHGGTYDHVPPPWGACPPWGNGAPAGLPKGLEKDFQFDRFGVRVPAILVSPRIAPGTVFRSPTETPYDHTSVIATVLQLLLPDVPRTEWGLGERVAHAPTFENMLTLQEPRQDKLFAPQAPPPMGTPLNYGDAFNLRHASGERVTTAYPGIFYYFPTLGTGQSVRLDFRGGWGPVNSGAIVQIRTDEYLTPSLRVEPASIFAGIRNFLGAWKDRRDCYYFSTNDSEDYGQQYWVITRADGSNGPIHYGDTVILVSNFSDFNGQRLAKNGGYVTTDANAFDTWVIEPAMPDGEILTRTRTITMASESQVSDQKATKPPAQILIIRHGEKPGDPCGENEADGPDLSIKGQERAAALAFNFPAVFGKIDHLFATRKSTNSNRPVETLTPLRKALKLKLNHDFKDDDFKGIADHILGNPKYSGTRILICWHHGKIPQLAAALHVANPPSPWPCGVFDRVWIIDYEAGSAALRNVPQKLLYDDSDA